MSVKNTVRHYKNEVFLISFVGSILLIILLVTVFGERCSIETTCSNSQPRCGNPFANWFLDFQTLITGFFAVGAAVFTIKTMNNNTKSMLDKPKQELIVKAKNIAESINTKINATAALLQLVIAKPDSGPECAKEINATIMAFRDIVHDCDAIVKNGLDIYTGNFTTSRNTLSSHADALERLHAAIRKKWKSTPSSLISKPDIDNIMHTMLLSLDNLRRFDLRNLNAFIEANEPSD